MQYNKCFKSRLIGVLPLLLICAVMQGQSDWKLKSTKDSIFIYTKSLPDSKLKALKIETVLPFKASQLVAAIFDINTSAQWVYATKVATLLQQPSPLEVYYYSEVSLPWPANNRDFVAHIKAKQDGTTKTIVIDADNLAGMVKEKEGIVRVYHSTARWVIQPNKQGVSIIYTLQFDPGGAVPAWLSNMVMSKGPYETFRNLKAFLQRNSYASKKGLVLE